MKGSTRSPQSVFVSWKSHHILMPDDQSRCSSFFSFLSLKSRILTTQICKQEKQTTTQGFRFEVMLRNVKQKTRHFGCVSPLLPLVASDLQAQKQDKDNQCELGIFCRNGHPTTFCSCVLTSSSSLLDVPCGEQKSAWCEINNQLAAAIPFASCSPLSQSFLQNSPGNKDRTTIAKGQVSSIFKAPPNNPF